MATQHTMARPEIKKQPIEKAKLTSRDRAIAKVAGRSRRVAKVFHFCPLNHEVKRVTMMVSGSGKMRLRWWCEACQAAFTHVVKDVRFDLGE